MKQDAGSLNRIMAVFSKMAPLFSPVFWCVLLAFGASPSTPVDDSMLSF
jgi:hypothetical protein